MTKLGLCVLILLTGFIQKGNASEGLCQLGEFSFSTDSFTINVRNETKHTTFIYIDNELAYALDPGKSKTGYTVETAKEIYAITFDEKLKWGPIDLKAQKTDFYWKIKHKSSGGNVAEDKTKSEN